MPVGEEAAERGGRHRLDLLAQPRQRSPLERAQHLHVAPLAAALAGGDVALGDAARGAERAERDAGRGHAEAEARGEILDRERAVGARVARAEIAERVGDRGEQRGRHAARELHPQRVAEAGRVLDRDEARLAGDDHGERAVGPGELGDQRGRDLGGRDTLRDLGLGEIAEREQQIVQPVGVGDRAVPVEPLQRALGLGDGVGVEQLTQLGLAEQLLELRGVDAERVGAALGERRVAVIEEVADVGEHQRRGEGRRDA